MNQFSAFLAKFEDSYQDINKQLDVLDSRISTCKKNCKPLDPTIVAIKEEFKNEALKNAVSGGW